MTGGDARKVFLLSAGAERPGIPEKAALDFEQLKRDAAQDRFGLHRVVSDPAEADLLLFVETSWAAGHYFEWVRRHPLYRRYRDRSYLFCSADRVVPIIPGVFTSIERSQYRPAWTRSAHYLGVREDGELRYLAEAETEYLFSFVGSGATDPIRSSILALRHPQALLIDTANEKPGGDYRSRYAESLRASQFVICPRGGGPASFRLFETMMLGRAPVIVSDQWVAPNGPSWEDFSIRVAEAEIDTIPALLEERSAAAAEMGQRARQAWLEWFAPDVAFHRIVELCRSLEDFSPERRGLRRFAPFRDLAQPREMLRFAAKRLGHGRDDAI